MNRLKSYSINRALRQERGVVLMSALIILLTLTLIGLALIRLSVVELKVAGASQRYQVLFNDAESIAALYFYSNQANLVDGCLGNGFNTGDGLPGAPVVDQCRYLEGASNNSTPLISRRTGGLATSIVIPNILTDFSRVQLTVEQMSCVDNYFSQVNSGQANDLTAPAAVFFNVVARAWDQLDTDSSVTIHTGLVAAMPPGAPCLAQGN